MNAPDFSKTLKTTQQIAYIALGLLVVTNFIWASVYFSSRKKGEERVYVVSDATTVAARLVSDNKPTVYEAKNHVRNFTTLMHSHDASTYEERINSALKLIDKQVGALLYNRMKKGGILEHYTRFNSRTDMEVDSVIVNMSVEPYKGSVYSHQFYRYDTETETIPIAADFELIRVNRSDDNPFGLQITSFDYKPYTTK